MTDKIFVGQIRPEWCERHKGAFAWMRSNSAGRYHFGFSKEQPYLRMSKW